MFSTIASAFASFVLALGMGSPMTNELVHDVDAKKAAFLQVLETTPNVAQNDNVKRAIAVLGLKHPVYVRNDTNTGAVFGVILLNEEDANAPFEALCFILAHEEGHLVLDHANEIVKYAVKASPSPVTAVSQITDLVPAELYHQHEFQADEFAKALTSEHNVFYPVAFEKFLRGYGFVTEATSTHPSVTARMKALVQ